MATMTANGRVLAVDLHGDAVRAAQGAMVAFTGAVQFTGAGMGGGDGLRAALKRKVAGEALQLMECSAPGGCTWPRRAGRRGRRPRGRHAAVESEQLLAVTPGCDRREVRRARRRRRRSGAGHHDGDRSRPGRVLSDGPVIVLEVPRSPLVVDPQAYVASTGQLSRLRLRRVLALAVGEGSGEPFSLRFDGDGIVLHPACGALSRALREGQQQGRPGARRRCATVSPAAARCSATRARWRSGRCTGARRRGGRHGRRRARRRVHPADGQPTGAARCSTATAACTSRRRARRRGTLLVEADRLLAHDADLQTSVQFLGARRRPGRGARRGDRAGPVHHQARRPRRRRAALARRTRVEVRPGSPSGSTRRRTWVTSAPSTWSSRPGRLARRGRPGSRRGVPAAGQRHRHGATCRPPRGRSGGGTVRLLPGDAAAERQRQPLRLLRRLERQWFIGRAR